MLLFLALACSTPSDTLRSAPTEPTVQLQTEESQSVTWKTLEGLLPKARAHFPDALPGLKLGMPEAEARAILELARHPTLEAPADKQFDDTLLLFGQLSAFDTIGVTLFIREGKLAEVDLSVPADEAMFAVVEAWGEPDEQVAGNSRLPVPVWKGEGVRATLIHTDKSLAILKYSKAE